MDDNHMMRKAHGLRADDDDAVMDEVQRCGSEGAFRGNPSLCTHCFKIKVKKTSFHHPGHSAIVTHTRHL